MRTIIAVAATLFVTGCASRPEGVWIGECSGTRDDDGSAFSMPFGIDIIRPDEENAPVGELFGSEGSFRLMHLRDVMIGPEGETDEDGEYRSFQVPDLVTCESATCRLDDTDFREPFAEFNNVDSVAGDAWITAFASGDEQSADFKIHTHNLVVAGHIAGETFTGDLIWETKVRAALEPEATRIGRGTCSIDHVPQGFFDDYNEL